MLDRAKHKGLERFVLLHLQKGIELPLGIGGILVHLISETAVFPP